MLSPVGCVLTRHLDAIFSYKINDEFRVAGPLLLLAEETHEHRVAQHVDSWTARRPSERGFQSYVGVYGLLPKSNQT
jgi:hypothetical protein